MQQLHCYGLRRITFDHFNRSQTLSRSVSCIHCKVEVSYNYIPIVAKYITIPG